MYAEHFLQNLVHLNYYSSVYKFTLLANLTVLPNLKYYVFLPETSPIFLKDRMFYSVIKIFSVLG